MGKIKKCIALYDVIFYYMTIERRYYMYTSREIQDTINVVIHLDTLIEQGMREGWGYDCLSTARVITYLMNEKKMIEEKERR